MKKPDLKLKSMEGLKRQLLMRRRDIEETMSELQKIIMMHIVIIRYTKVMI